MQNEKTYTAEIDKELNETGVIRSAEILTIGTEILLGDLVDTNSAYLGGRLAALGVSIYRHTTVGDNAERITAALREAASRADLVITTGGLGPTSDDLTNQCLGKAAGREMVEYSEARRHVDEMFRRFGRKPTPSNYKQALFPEGSKLIPNPVGTAMGAMLELDGALVATFPGVPGEMRRMFEDTLEPLIRERSEGAIVSRTLWFTGIGESALAEQVQHLLDASDPTVAPLAGQGKVRLRITTRANTPEEAEKKITPVADEILSRLGDYYFGQDDETLESALGKLLTERGATLALAESCTGGLLAKRLTDGAGASAYFVEGLVTYSNESKEQLLGVPNELLVEYGAVSEPVAGAMAEGARKVAGTDYGVSVTGVAGPDGGSEEKPVGLVFVGVSDAEGTEVERLDLSAWRRSREAIRERSANRAFDLLRHRILGQDEA
ncbi:MAG: ADP-ribose pyrophosphatase of COG1058 family / Nicotinamide-nucleotide amidase [uncultured Rubrobacteraceae bacterium]|uniref:CinA-like protein n=1 Tax=uncultured Rubrobacteraceae bacterium TaxID=349277 RepID=A0A6J4Q121_9ACTN|nr:MAG: ADP-ribose pyrophosphatase of COG1058 family / Nicotinamide-nucleotide amidase [uncultured Rubrobacteraceae bacterium]